MRINVTGGGGPTFLVQNAHREDLAVPSVLTGYDAVRLVADWLAVKAEPAAVVPEVVEDAPKVGKGRTMVPPPKADEPKGDV